MTAQPLLDDLATGTITVADGRVFHAARAYRDLFGYETRYEGRLCETLAETWGISDPDRTVILLGAKGEEHGLVRFVAGPISPPHPYSTRGWAALEITVRDVDTLTETVHSSKDFRVNGEPTDLGFGGRPPAIRASQTIGPADEQPYLTQVLGTGTGHVIPPVDCEVGAMFVAVLLFTDLETQLTPYLAGLGLKPAWRFEAAIEMISKEAGMPLDHVTSSPCCHRGAGRGWRWIDSRRTAPSDATRRMSSRRVSGSEDFAETVLAVASFAPTVAISRIFVGQVVPAQEGSTLSWVFYTSPISSIVVDSEAVTRVVAAAAAGITTVAPVPSSRGEVSSTSTVARPAVTARMRNSGTSRRFNARLFARCSHNQ